MDCLSQKGQRIPRKHLQNLKPRKRNGAKWSRRAGNLSNLLIYIYSMLLFYITYYREVEIEV